MAIVRTPLTSSIGLPATALASLLSDTRVLVAGDVMLDRYWFGDVRRISPEAPVPIVQVQRSDDRLGGAANVARNIAALGAHASLMGRVGTDEAGQRVHALLADASIIDMLSDSAALPTIVKLRVLGRQQQLLRIDFDPVPIAVAPPFTLPGCDVLRRHQALLVSDYAKGTLAEVPSLMAAARESGLPVLVDPKGDDYAMYAGATLIKPNMAELQRVVGIWRDEADLQCRAQALRRALRIDALLLTRSEEGMSLFDADGVRHFAAQAREVFDVSGAGDTVIAVIATLLAAGIPLESAVLVANHAAGLAVSKLGTAVVSFDELFG